MTNATAFSLSLAQMATRRPTTTTTRTRPLNDDDDLQSLVSEQQRELMAAEALESDLDLAFHLQLQEALSASLAQQPSSSSSATAPDPRPPKSDDVRGFAAYQSDELSRLEQELKDREQSEIEMRRMREDLCRRIHDQKVANEIMRIPEEDWREWGDNFEKPFGEGSSSGGGGGGRECNFRLYCKGLVSEDKAGDKKNVLNGIGVAICDPKDNLIFEVSKPLIGNGINKTAAEAKALIEGLNAALAWDLNRIVFYCDYYPLFQFVSKPSFPNLKSNNNYYNK